jgi:hypothetical protein
LPKYSRILKVFYFTLWSVSKFNLANSSCGWSSMWLHHRIEKKTKTKLQFLPIVSWNRDHLSIVSWNCDHFHFYQRSISPDKQRRVSILSKKEHPNCCDGSQTLQDSLL